MAEVESSRVFVTGLPKSLTSAQLALHFSQQFHVTDAHVLPDRRIGFVGFSDHDTANVAVKHYNRSYIRMSKITVDLAKPIEINQGQNGQAVPVSQRARHSQAQWQSKRNATGTDAVSMIGDRKRKRDVEDDGEQARSGIHPNNTQPSSDLPVVQFSGSEESPTTSDQQQQKEGAESTTTRTDDDWLRGKTSRLLDLETPEEVTQRQSGRPAMVEEIVQDGPVESVLLPEENQGDERIPREPLVPNGRLFIRNIAFSITEDDLKQQFGKFGKVQEVHIVVDNRKSVSKGMAYIQFSEPAEAESALRNMDGSAFHGRLLHILPAADKRDLGLTEYDLSKLPLKKQKALRRKLEACTASFSWNSLYMNPDAVVSSIASRLGVSKSDILDPTSSDAAVKQAHAETQIIAETKAYLSSHGVQVKAFKNKVRDDRTILLKNFPFSTSENELRELLDPHGQIAKFILPPTGTMALAEFVESYSATQALKGLAYKNIKGSVLYLERAPQGLFSTDIASTAESRTSAAGATATAPTEKVRDDESGPTSTIFIRNLSFNTTTTRLVELLSPLGGFLSAKVKTRTDPKRPGEVLSMGFGFAEFQSPSDGNAAIAAINGHRLDGHELVVKPSTKSSDMAEEQRRSDNVKKSDANKTKIIIKNLPFQASKKDVRSLFSPYGQLKNVRVPKKFDNSSRGFAFAEFVTAKEASNAMESLSDTHLLGRRLILDFVDEEMVDAEEQIRAVEKKIEQQSNRINLSKLAGTGRKKFNVGSAEEDAY